MTSQRDVEPDEFEAAARRIAAVFYRLCHERELCPACLMAQLIGRLVHDQADAFNRHDGVHHRGGRTIN